MKVAEIPESARSRAARPTFATVAVGDQIPTVAYPLHRANMVRYAGASGDFNPIHWNQRFATEVGLPNVIAHGMLTMATAGRLVSDWAGDPGALVEYGVRFTKPVVVPDDEPGQPVATTAAEVSAGSGTVVEVSGVVTAKDEERRTVKIELTAICGGEKVLGRAQAVVRLP
jgi:acyl dehydratase